MKILTLAASTLLLSSTFAFAADVVYEAPVAPVEEVAEFYDWTGAYVGATAGYAWNKFETRTPEISDKEKLNGAFAGGYAGYNFLQSGPWVAGVEGDFVKDWADETYSALGETSKSELKWSASVRARAGYAFDRSLVYGTAGWAMTKFEDSTTTAFSTERHKETLNGWTVGAGFEQAFTDNVIGRVEYRYTDFSDKMIDGAEIDADKHTVGAGVSWKF
ncbi:porin family protein [Rhizobium sp. CFBP 8762]|uniref:outer membrane protein n=1 Tax=Rhizobium sp. CFBP 8762 TaxID=2775279 RepID=UPI001785E37E|nr:outer membrane protein [Rhizobium sp. CFBP 8762]MBD8554142.1 porin family protein [Rhizobium sp. CFBP 8762]